MVEEKIYYPDGRVFTTRIIPRQRHISLKGDLWDRIVEVLSTPIVGHYIRNPVTTPSFYDSPTPSDINKFVGKDVEIRGTPISKYYEREGFLLAPVLEVILEYGDVQMKAVSERLPASIRNMRPSNTISIDNAWEIYKRIRKGDEITLRGKLEIEDGSLRLKLHGVSIRDKYLSLFHYNSTQVQK